MSWFPGTYPAFGGFPYTAVDDHESCKKQLHIVNEDRAGLQTRLARALRDSDHQLAEKTKLKRDHESLQADHDALKKSHSSLEEQVKKLTATIADQKKNSVPSQDYYKAISEVQSNVQRGMAHEKTAKSYAETVKKLEKELEGLKAKADAAANTDYQLRTRLAASRSETEKANLKLKETSEKNTAMLEDADKKLKAAQRTLVEKAMQWNRKKLDLHKKYNTEQVELEKAQWEKQREQSCKMWREQVDECAKLTKERDEKARLANLYEQEALQQRDAQEKLRQKYHHQVTELEIAQDRHAMLLASWDVDKAKHEEEKKEHEDHIGYLKRQVEFYEGECVPDLESKLKTSQQENKDLKAKFATLDAQYSGLNVRYSDLMAVHADLQAQYSNTRDGLASISAANDEMEKGCDVLRAKLDKIQEQCQVLEASQVQKSQVIEEIKGSLAKEVEKGKKLAAENKRHCDFIEDVLERKEKLEEKYQSVWEENESSRKEHMVSLEELETERNRVRLLQARLEQEKAKYTEQIAQLRYACDELEAQNEDLIRELEGFDHVGQNEYYDEWSEQDYSAEGVWQLQEHEEEEEEKWEVTPEASNEEAE